MHYYFVDFLHCAYDDACRQYYERVDGMKISYNHLNSKWFKTMVGDMMVWGNTLFRRFSGFEKKAVEVSKVQKQGRKKLHFRY